MPLFTGIHPDNIKVVTQKKEADAAAAELSKYSCLSFDTESKPCFNKGESSTGPHLIQISSLEKAYLFPTKFPETIDAINQVLSNPNIKKVGFGLINDRKILKGKFGITLESAEELSTKVKRFAGVKENVGARAAVRSEERRVGKECRDGRWTE